MASLRSQDCIRLSHCVSCLPCKPTPLHCHLFMDKDEASYETTLSQIVFSLPLS